MKAFPGPHGQPEIEKLPPLTPKNPNVSRFIAFRVFFNARWYYPVLAVLFVDLGLTLEQYALLNAVWAAAIVGLEVPSGALADQLGRKRMVVMAAALMVVEMCIFAFAPRGSAWLFPLLVLNRILSGAAEASASGADEALVYDSLAAEGRAGEWPGVLERLMRWQSAAFFVAMLLGGVVYDAHAVQAVLSVFGFHGQVSQELTTRFPVYLTLGNAVLALVATLGLREAALAPQARVSAGASWKVILEAARWIWLTPAALLVILAGLCFDSIIRLFLTFGSSYYRLIALPEASFGLIGSGFSVLGFFTPTIARWLTGRFSRTTNFALVAVLTLAGLLGIAQAWPRWGVLVVLPLGVGMSLVQFFTSHYLNESVGDSSRRATVLSFRGLAFNLAYGAAGLFFAGLTHALRGAGGEEAVFAQALRWLPWYFAATLALLAAAFLRLARRAKPQHTQRATP